MRVLDKLTYAGREENLEGAGAELVGGRDRGPRRGRARRWRAADAVVNFAAESHVDRSIEDQDAVRAHPRDRHRRAARRRRASSGVSRYLQVSTDEVYGSIELGLVHRDVADRPLLALLGDQGRRRPAGLRARPHLRHRGGDLPRLEQLRPAPVPREADPADACSTRCTATRCPSTATAARCATGCTWRTSPAPSTRCWRAGGPARPTTSAAPTRCENIDVVKRILELTGRDESLIEHVTDRPGHDRRYSLGSEKIRASWAGRRGALRGGPGARPSSGTATTRRGGGRSARGEYREYYERHYGRALG